MQSWYKCKIYTIFGIYLVYISSDHVLIICVDHVIYPWSYILIIYLSYPIFHGLDLRFPRIRFPLAEFQTFWDILCPTRSLIFFSIFCLFDFLLIFSLSYGHISVYCPKVAVAIFSVSIIIMFSNRKCLTRTTNSLVHHFF